MFVVLAIAFGCLLGYVTDPRRRRRRLPTWRRFE
jgi:hypothetical protein